MMPFLIITNYWAADYKIQLFNSIFDIFKDFSVLYMAETENMRSWKVDKKDINFPHEIMFNGALDDVKPINIFRATWTRLDKYDPRVVIVGGYNYPAYWAAFLWAKVKNRKIILWSASNREDRKRLLIKEMVKSFFVRNCDAANVYGERNKEYLMSLGMDGKKISIKGNCTDNGYYAVETQKYRTNKKQLCDECGLPERNFLYIGRLSPEKNIFRLLEGYGKARANCRERWGLILVGDGPQRKQVEEYIAKFHLDDVFLAGFRQKNEIPKFLAMSDVFVLPSTSEPWGLVANEAMAAGLPVIVSRNCGCYPDLIAEGSNGFSFDPDNVNELCSFLCRFMDREFDAEPMGQRSMDIIREYTTARAARVIVDTVEKVIKG